jgi:hypothetical protein
MQVGMVIAAVLHHRVFSALLGELVKRGLAITIYQLHLEVQVLLEVVVPITITLMQVQEEEEEDMPHQGHLVHLGMQQMARDQVKVVELLDTLT